MRGSRLIHFVAELRGEREELDKFTGKKIQLPLLACFIASAADWRTRTEAPVPSAWREAPRMAEASHDMTLRSFEAA
jgi:hypothetical protein